ncbi:DUF7577 domain-containing protein [Halocatena marina]|uniref:DUF7577 domain-containing protein n=1 Tax=Halocatena marina TaxID=2934937 RepID=UPI003F610534
MVAFDQLITILLVAFLSYAFIFVLLYRSVTNDDEKPDVSSTTTPHPDPAILLENSPRKSGPPSTIECWHCGTENDREYTYCKNCITVLASYEIQSSSM